MPQRSKQSPPEEPAVILVKKYPNRRLYDTSNRRYVNLEDIAALIRQGEHVKVVDAQTGEDLTRVILTQIIVEDAKGQPSGLPLELLRQLVMASDRARQELIGWYLKNAFDAYHKVQEAVQTRLDDVRTAALGPLGMVKNLFATKGADGAGEELDILRRRVAELEARLAEAEARPRKKREPVRRTGPTAAKNPTSSTTSGQ